MLLPLQLLLFPQVTPHLLPTACKAGGVLVAGQCYYLAPVGESCDEGCSGFVEDWWQGKCDSGYGYGTMSMATMMAGPTLPSLSLCRDIADKLGLPYASWGETISDGTGCVYDQVTGRVMYSGGMMETCDAVSTDATAQRICTCDFGVCSPAPAEPANRFPTAISAVLVAGEPPPPAAAFERLSSLVTRNTLLMPCCARADKRAKELTRSQVLAPAARFCSPYCTHQWHCLSAPL